MHVKGLDQSAYDCCGARSMALAYGTSDIGAHHTRAINIKMGAARSDDDPPERVPLSPFTPGPWPARPAPTSNTNRC